MATLNGVDLGYLQSEGPQLDSGVLYVASATGDSSETEAVKVINTKKIIGLSGVVTTDIDTFITSFESWIDYSNAGVQKYTYVGGKISSTNVVVLKGSWDWVAGAPNSITYSLELLVVRA